MSDVLIVSPFSGRGVGGGVAVATQDLTKAFSDAGHKVKLLTFRLPDNSALDPSLHGDTTEILYIENSEAMGVKSPKNTDCERELLYDLLNSDAVLLSEPVKKLLKSDDWKPTIILGHSRFSGPAAIKLRKALFPLAKVEYLLHSYPLEGSILVGYDVYGERISAESARQKIEIEKRWMPDADIVVGVGPLMRYGATLILQEANKKIRIHECIFGTEVDEDPVAYINPEEPITLMMSGRANVPIKGFEDLLLATAKLREKDIHFRLHVRGWEDKKYTNGDVVTRANAQQWANGVLGIKDLDSTSVVDIRGMTNNGTELKQEIRASHGVLMPSYAEHYGIVPFDALGLGVPVLMSEFSGAALFLGDSDRFDNYGQTSIVQDFGDESKRRPFDPIDFLQDVKPDSFDRRPNAWANAIEKHILNLEDRFASARVLRDRLAGYTWAHCANALLAAPSFEGGQFSKQGAKGEILGVR